MTFSFWKLSTIVGDAVLEFVKAGSDEVKSEQIAWKTAGELWQLAKPLISEDVIQTFNDLRERLTQYTYQAEALADPTPVTTGTTKLTLKYLQAWIAAIEKWSPPDFDLQLIAPFDGLYRLISELATTDQELARAPDGIVAIESSADSDLLPSLEPVGDSILSETTPQTDEEKNENST